MDELGKDLDRAIGGEAGWREAPLFRLGRVEVSEDAARVLADAHGPADPAHVNPYLERHRRGDWPTLSEGERQANLSAIEHGGAITARYALPNPDGRPARDRPGSAISIKTEAETSIGRRDLTMVDVAETIDLFVFRGEEFSRVLYANQHSPTGYTSLTGAFPSPQEAIDVFVRSVREGPSAWSPRTHLRFFDLRTRELLRDA